MCSTKQKACLDEKSLFWMQGEPGGLHHCEPRDGTHPVLPSVQRPILLLPHWWPMSWCLILLTHKGESYFLKTSLLFLNCAQNNRDIYTSDCELKRCLYFWVAGANPGFHEGVADILSLAVGTAEYFQVICVFTSVTPSPAHLKITTSFVFPRCSRCFHIPLLVS